MSISSATITRNSVLSGLSSGSSSYCSTCGKATSATSNVYAGYGGRIGTDTYVCETCGKTLTSQKNSSSQSKSTYTAAGVSSSGYCPRCNSSSSTASWTGAVSKTSPPVSTSSAKSAGTSYGSASWVK